MSIRVFRVGRALGVLALCWGLQASPLWADAPAPLHLSLAESFQIALKNSPDTATYRSKIRQAEWQVEQARAPGLPQLEFDTSYTRIEPPVSVSLGGARIDIIDENNYKFGPVLRQAIATFGRLHYGVLAARLQEQSTRNDYRRVADTVLSQVGTVYDQALQAAQNVTIAQANVGLREAHLADTQKLLAAGTVARYDVIRGQVDLSQARQQLISAQNSYNNAVVQLLSLLGLDPSSPVVLADAGAPAPPPANRENAVATALERRPELATINYAWQSAQATVHYYKSQLNPTLSLQATYIDENITGFTTPNQFSGTLQLAIPMLDGGAARAEANQALEQAEQLHQQYESARRSVVADVEGAWLNLQSSWQRLALAGQNVQDTQRLVQIAEVQYRGGVSTNLERLDAENTLVQVQSAAASALYDYLQAQVQWQKATGQDYPAEVVDSLIMPPREENVPLAPGMRPRDAGRVIQTGPTGPFRPIVPGPPPPPSPDVQSPPIPSSSPVP